MLLVSAAMLSIEPPPCSLTRFVYGPRRLELRAFYAPATTRAVTTRRYITPSGSNSLAVVTTPLEGLPPGLTQARFVELRLTLRLTLFAKRTLCCYSVLIYCIPVYSI